MNPEQLDAAWQSLATPDTAQQLAAKSIAGNDAWVAVDHEGLRHLLLVVPDGTEAPATVTRGLRVTVARHQVQGNEPADYREIVKTCG